MRELTPRRMWVWLIVHLVTAVIVFCTAVRGGQFQGGIYDIANTEKLRGFYVLLPLTGVSIIISYLTTCDDWWSFWRGRLFDAVGATSTKYKVAASMYLIAVPLTLIPSVMLWAGKITLSPESFVFWLPYTLLFMGVSVVIIYLPTTEKN